MKRYMLFFALVMLLATGSIFHLDGQRFRRFPERSNTIHETTEIPKTEFVFARIRFTTHGGAWEMSGWEHDYPAAEQHINALVEETTGLDVGRMSYQVIRLDDPNLFAYPFIYISEPGTMKLTQREIDGFREYLDRGGFVMVDDFDGYDDLSNWNWNLKQIYPDREMIPLTVDHPIFHTFYEITDLDVTAFAAANGWPVFFGYPTENGKDTSMIICFNNDIGDLWEWLDQPVYPLKPSAEGVRLGINFVLYALTH